MRVAHRPTIRVQWTVSLAGAIVDTPTPIAYVLASNELDLEALLD